MLDGVIGRLRLYVANCILSLESSTLSQMRSGGRRRWWRIWWGRIYFCSIGIWRWRWFIEIFSVGHNWLLV